MQKRADKAPATENTGRRGRNLPAALCGVVGRIILALVILVCLPVPVMHLLGYEVYDVVSGSMEPAIPVGSAVFVHAAPPGQLQAGDVIAFHSRGTTITHRVVENDAAASLITTQGDANEQPDIDKVPYSDVIGRVEKHVPMLGWMLSVYTGGSGRVYLICFAASGALLSIVSALLTRRGEKEDETPGETGETQG